MDHREAQRVQERDLLLVVLVGCCARDVVDRAGFGERLAQEQIVALQTAADALEPRVDVGGFHLARDEAQFLAADRIARVARTREPHAGIEALEIGAEHVGVAHPRRGFDHRHHLPEARRLGQHEAEAFGVLTRRAADAVDRVREEAHLLEDRIVGDRADLRGMRDLLRARAIFVLARDRA